MCDYLWIPEQWKLASTSNRRTTQISWEFLSTLSSHLSSPETNRYGPSSSTTQIRLKNLLWYKNTSISDLINKQLIIKIKHYKGDSNQALFHRDLFYIKQVCILQHISYICILLSYLYFPNTFSCNLGKIVLYFWRY
jgi:hypothetical protein